MSHEYPQYPGDEGRRGEVGDRPGSPSYTRTLRKRHLLPAVLLAGLLTAGGCTRMSSPLASNDLDTPLDLTGSIDGLGNGADTDIDKEDRRAIAAAIEAAKPTADGPAAIAWANPLSGNTGTVTTINADGGVSGCLAFRTTANTIHGVRAYDGTACRDAFSALSVITLARTRS